VFLNTCSSGQAGLSLTSIGGWAPHFLAAGAGAFVGTLWPVRDSRATIFAREFYRKFVAGAPLSQAMQAARAAVASPEDPSWLAYAAYANGEAVCGAADEKPGASEISLPQEEEAPLHLAQPRWDPFRSPPGALLRAEYGVVRFHGRERELADLHGWCMEGPAVRVRLYMGPGGMGKTRLALETARLLRAEGWQAGFLSPNPALPAAAIWPTLSRRGGRMLLIVDYAETRRELLIPILRAIHQAQEGPIRVLLLARAALDWWEQLKQERDGVGELLSSAATSKHPLGALAMSVPQRVQSFAYAVEDFAGRLGKAIPAATLEEPEQEHFERVLLLHMSALAAIEGVEVKGELGILDFVLDRERRHWGERALAIGLPQTLVPGIGRAMAAITLAGGAENESEVVAVLRRLRFFQDQKQDVLLAVGRLLRQTYPDAKQGIEPILPDLLAEHLIQRELEAGADELLDLVLGPRSAGPAQASPIPPSSTP
jgi:hypothetical protein